MWKARETRRVLQRFITAGRILETLRVLDAADRDLIQRQIDAADRSIDALVASRELYGLTAEEIKIVEGEK